MIETIKQFIYEPKSKIGWVHGLSTCVASLICAYLSTGTYTNIIEADNAHKIIPAMISTPIFICIFALWFLFSNTYIDFIKKLSWSFLILFIVFSFSYKGVL